MRFELKPAQVKQIEAPPVESEKLTGNTWGELQASAAKMQLKARAERYEQLRQQQGIEADPAAVGVGTEVEISGGRLTNHPQLWKILEPASAETQAKTPERRMSAAEWKAAHIEDFRPEGGLELAKKTWDRNVATFCSSRPEYLASEASGEKMQAFIRANGLDYNVQHLEAAFRYLKSRNELELKEAAVIDGPLARVRKLLGGKHSSRTCKLALNLRRSSNALSKTSCIEWKL